MKGGRSSKVVQRLSTVVALLALFRSCLALTLPSNEELHALTDLAGTNAGAATEAGGALESWKLAWSANGTWIGGNPCVGFRGLKCWSKTSNLRVLNVTSAGLQGLISPAFGNLTTLNELTLAENNMSGNIAFVLETLTWMKTLRLQGNNFNGSLSNWVQKMPLLEVLMLAGNSLDGNISTGVFTNLIHLTIVDISNNSLSGPIPEDLVGLPSLLVLVLRGNNFSGSVPSLSNSSLIIVDLSGNSLKGNLSTDWNTPNLTSLDLSGNNMSGPIPEQLLNLNTTNFKLNLAQNSFVGNVSTKYSRKFGCKAFAGNPGLIMEDLSCKPSTVAGSPIVTPFPDTVSSKGFSALTIAALVLGDFALVLVSVVGFVMFYMWWRKKDIHDQDGGDNKLYTAWPSASKGDFPWPYASKGDLSGSNARVVTGNVISTGFPPGSGTVSEARSSFATKPALKSVNRVKADPNDMMADFSSSDSLNNEFGNDIVILDTTLMLELDELMHAKALLLGAGSHGVVYMACLDDGEMLVIKRIEELDVVDEPAFGQQCEHLAEVMHPNLLQLRAYWWSEQEKLLITDYMENGSVHSLLHEGKGSPAKGSVDWATRLRIAVGTARALAHLHDNDMVHGNIKASNVLLDGQFEPRVSDFGMESLLRKPLQKRAASSDAYLAPELCACTTHRRSQDGDVYSLGVFLLELLTGKQPKEHSVALPLWVQEMTLANRTVQLFDPVLTSMHVLPAQDVLEFLELAQACVATDAAARPSITIVLRTLESIVPGSTAPRSYVKDDNIDSDLSLRETTNTPNSQAIAISVDDGDEYEDDGGDSKFSASNQFFPGFREPSRIPETGQEGPAHLSGNCMSPVSSTGDFYSNVSTPITSPFRSGTVEGFPFVSIPIL